MVTDCAWEGLCNVFYEWECFHCDLGISMEDLKTSLEMLLLSSFGHTFLANVLQQIVSDKINIDYAQLIMVDDT